MNQITVNTALEIASHEALVREAYKDSVGVWTWSIGITNASGHSVLRYISKPQTIQHCLEIFIWVLENKYAPAVRHAFRGHDLTEAQFAAALSFHYNTGAINRASWVKKFKAGQIAGAKKAFMSWRKPPEIIPRRKKERDLFFNGQWSNDGKITVYPVTSSKHPDFRHGKRVDVKKDLEALLNDQKPVPEQPKADYIPVTPDNSKPASKAGPIVVVIITAIAGMIAGGWDWIVSIFN